MFRPLSAVLKPASAVVLAAIVLLAASMAASVARAELPARYRDFKIYTTSSPSASDPARITAVATLLNEGKRPLQVHLELEPNSALGFRGAAVDRNIPAGDAAKWNIDLQVPAGFRREILSGHIAFGKVRDRDLFMLVQGADPADFDDTRVEKITEPARIVATYAPRTRASILASMEALAAHKAKQPRLTIATGGKSDYTIALGLMSAPAAAASAPAQTFADWSLAAERTPAERELVEAVQDLERAIELKSGAKLPIHGAGAGAKSPVIAIGTRQPPAENSKPAEGYKLEAVGKDVFIDASTPEGLRNGVYALLTDHLDSHWFQPGKLGEEIVVPSDRTVTLPANLSENASPAWFSVSGMSFSHAPKWDRQNRAVTNRGRMNFGHSWYDYINTGTYPYEKFSDMYARDRQGKILKKDEGWTYTNFCTTSPEVIDVVARKVNERFDADPAAIVVSLDPNDYAPMCLCDRCLALDKQYGQTKEDGKEVADRLLHFSQQIHDRLKPQHQQKFLGILIYGYQMELPVSARPHAHHAGIICNFPPRYDHTRPWNDPTSEKNRDFVRLIDGWGKQLKNFGYYDYYGHYYFFGPWAVVHKMREDLPAFADRGGTFLFMEAQPNFGMQGVNLYVAARLAWDKDCDVDLLLEEFFAKYYGPAADAMREFWLGAERHYALTRPGTHAERAADDPTFWSELEGRLRQAETAVAGSEQRFQDRVTFQRAGFDLGQKLYELSKVAPRKREVKDRAAAIAKAREAKAYLDSVKAKYPAGDAYWPPLIAPYFYPEFDAMIEKLEKGGS